MASQGASAVRPARRPDTARAIVIAGCVASLFAASPTLGQDAPLHDEAQLDPVKTTDRQFFGQFDRDMLVTIEWIKSKFSALVRGLDSDASDLRGSEVRMHWAQAWLHHLKLSARKTGGRGDQVVVLLLKSGPGSWTARDTEPYWRAYTQGRTTPFACAANRLCQFAAARIDETLAREGAYVNHPADLGGPTKYGITQRTLSDWLGWQATEDEVKNVDEDTARKIYVVRYLTGPGIHTLAPELVAPVFDMAVHMGPHRAIRMTQEALNFMGWRVAVNGVLNPETRRAAAEAQALLGPLLTNVVAEHRANFYRQIVAGDESQRVFLRGWLRRAEALKAPAGASDYAR